MNESGAQSEQGLKFVQMLCTEELTCTGPTLPKHHINNNNTTRRNSCVQSEAYVGSRIFMHEKSQSCSKEGCPLRWSRNHMQDTGGAELLTQRQLVSVSASAEIQITTSAAAGGALRVLYSLHRGEARGALRHCSERQISIMYRNLFLF